ncbi:MAG TPA: hypothetical protein VFJ82_07955, partial [Longimicrobium sp.]|nr:hypothetical protein [Longimicrobium sp.]
MSTEQEHALRVRIAGVEPPGPTARPLRDDPRWSRLLQPAAIPFDPSALLGGEFPAEPDVANCNNVARFLEICALPPYLVGPVMNGNAALGDDARTFWSDNVFTWSSSGAFAIPRLWESSLLRYRDRGGLLVAMLAVTVEEGDEPLTILNWLVLDFGRGRADRIDPDDSAKEGLDDHLGALCRGLGLAYFTPEASGGDYRALVRRLPIPWAAPGNVLSNMWAFWLLYCRLFFSDAAHDAVFAEARRRLGGGEVNVGNLLLNFYPSFTTDANVHTFGSAGFITAYPSDRDRWRYDPRLVARVARITTLGSSRSQLNQVWSAALREAITDSAAYDALYLRYMGIAPLYPPTCQDCGGWVPEAAMDDGLARLLSGGVVRFGCVPDGLYVTDGLDAGFDHDLAALALEKVRVRYGLERLGAKWIAAGTQPVSEAGRLELLCDGLAQGDFDIAMSGQLVEAAVDAPAAHPEWTCATSRLFTGIYYSGKDAERMRPVLEGLVGGTRQAFVESVVKNFADVELRVISASNPGPSPTGATDLVRDINLAGGRAAWITLGDVDAIKDQFRAREVHLAVGDSNQNSALCAQVGFPSLNLDLPAIDGQDP